MAQSRRLGVLGLTTSLKGLKNSPKLTPRAAKIAASASTVTPLSPRSSLTHDQHRPEGAKPVHQLADPDVVIRYPPCLMSAVLRVRQQYSSVN